MKKYRVSGSNHTKKNKGTTFRYKLFETDSATDFLKYISTHAVCPAVFKKGHRLNDNITEILPMFRIDVDTKGMDKKVQKALKKAKVHFIKKPSTSNVNKGENWKWHYVIPVSNISQDLDGYKLQYHKFLNSVGIDKAWVDMSLERVSQNLNPAGSDGIEFSIMSGKKIPKIDAVVVPKKSKISSLNNEKVKKEDKLKVIAKLKTLNPDMSEPNWHVVAQALHGWSDNVGYKLFKKWSKKSDKFSQSKLDIKWDNLQRNDTGVVTLGTLFAMMSDGSVKQPDVFDNEKPLSDKRRKELKEKKEVKVKKEKKKEKKEKKEKLKNFDPYNVGGELTEDKLEAMKNMRILYDNIIPEGMHTFIYGSAGSMKTTLMSWLCVDVLKRHEEKVVHMWSFDASMNHEASILQYTIDEDVIDRYKLYNQHTIDDYHAHYDMAIEQESNLDRLVIVIDTYKFVTTDVNSKSANKKALHYIKQLTALGATVLSLGHTNKDGLRNSGTAEVEQDSDNVLRINRRVDEFSQAVTLTVEAAGRTRFNCSPTSFKLQPEGSNYDYLYSALITAQELDVAVDMSDVEISEETKDNKAEKIKELKDRSFVDEIAKVIHELNNNNNEFLNATQPILVKEMKERESMSKAKVDTLLREYNGVRWSYKDKLDKRNKKTVKQYKLKKHPKKE